MKKILLLHTGGTIGMTSSKGKMEGLRPARFGSYLVDWVPELKRIANIEIQVLDNIDSSDVTPLHWSRWLEELGKVYNHYDGFVMTHGTDTMAYSGSALSFALRTLDKPIVLTGSQRPLSLVRTDARDNLINAVELATYGPCEVSLCFGNQLLRANRATKFSATDYVAFESFNFPRLGEMGVKIESKWKTVSSDQTPRKGKPRWLTRFDQNVFSFKIFPGISAEILKETVKNPACHGLVLEAFGSGTVPSIDKSVLNVIGLASELGKPVVIVSQCPHGRVDLHLYEAGNLALKNGAISAGDMTREASVVKLMHGLGQKLPLQKLKSYFLKNVCGERTV